METMPGCACKNSAVPSSEPLSTAIISISLRLAPDDFFLYQNEIDVSFQLRLQGYDIYYDPACIICL
jgi:hypothetical protein